MPNSSNTTKSKGSKYLHVSRKNVQRTRWDKENPWVATVPVAGSPRNPIVKHFSDEREAALFVDKTLLSLGKDPVNILKRK